MRRLLFFLSVLAVVSTACAGAAVPDADPATDAPTGAQESPASTEGTSSVGTTEAGADALGVYGFAEGSEVRFIIDEELRGSPKTVVGVNTALQGTFTVDPATLEVVDWTAVRIDAAAFVTDDDRRNGSIDRFILNVSANPEMTFTIDEVGSESIEGRLEILGVEVPVVFTLTKVPSVGDEPLALSGTATVNRTDWGINIPSVSFIANVAEEVTLEFDFVLELIDG